MGAKIWDSAAQAFAEPQNVPKRYDPNPGAYVDTAGKAFDHDAEAWVEKWSPNRVLYLYKDGDECTDVTGGWGNDLVISAWNGNTMHKVSPVKNGNYMKLSVARSGTYVYSAVDTAEMIDLRRRSIISAEIEVVAPTQNVVFGCNDKKLLDNPWDIRYITELQSRAPNGTYIMEIDVGTAESGFIIMAVSAGIYSDAFGAVNIKKIWLE